MVVVRVRSRPRQHWRFVACPITARHCLAVSFNNVPAACEPSHALYHLNSHLITLVAITHVVVHGAVESYVHSTKTSSTTLERSDKNQLSSRTHCSSISVAEIHRHSIHNWSSTIQIAKVATVSALRNRL